MCERLYQKNVYLTECDSIIVDIPKPGCIVLDRTIFFPEGGGQPCDKGTINGYPVTNVNESDGRIIHRLTITDPSQDNGSNELKIGQAVRCSLDWDRRFDHMQRHCGEHILSGIFFREYGGVNKGFHMGEDYMTIDIDMPSVTDQMAAHVELEANRIIWEDAPVTVRYFEKGADAADLPLRKELTLEGNVSVVCVGYEASPADCVACCGTHPASAGQVGLIKIFKSENHKGMSRVYFEAGKRALLDYSRKHAIITALAEKFSADDKTLIDKINAQEAKNAENRQELFRCKASLTDKEAVSLLEDICIPGIENDAGVQIVVREYDDLSTGDLQILAKKICASTAHLFILVSNPEKTILLSAGNSASKDAFDCGKLVRDHAGQYGGKGGGNAALARAAFDRYEDIDLFVSKVLESI